MFQKIYETYWNRMFALVARKVKDRDDILDIMQNIFCHLWNYRNSLTPQNAESVVIKTCIQEISNFFSEQKKQSFANDDISNAQLADDSSEQLQAILEKEEQLELLRKNIELLPATRRKIITMNKFEGITQEKIANNLTLSPKAVKKQLAKAIIFLRENHNHS
ncbi:sigma-70 family RNA polymerase sigma factor [Sphingobacterium multivorum]|nr:sigma-70 family RNA polymerase sigma factor [Sphingobacterium multivorum]